MPSMQQVPSTPPTRGPLIASSSRDAAKAPETSPTSSPRSHHLPTRLQEPSPALIRSSSQRDHIRVPIAEAWEQDPFASVNSSRRPSSTSANSDSPVLHQQPSFHRPSTQSKSKDPFQRSIIRWSQHYQRDSPSSIDGSPRRDHSHVEFHPKSRESIDEQEQHEDSSSTFRFAINPFRSSTPTPPTFADRAPRYPSDEKASSQPHRSRRTRHPRVPEPSAPSELFRDRPLGKYIAWFLIVALVAVVVSVTVTLSLASSRRANSDNVIGSFDSGVNYSPPPISDASASASLVVSNPASNARSASAILLSSSSSNVDAATALLTAPSSQTSSSSPMTRSAPLSRAARASSTTTSSSTRGKRALGRNRRGAHP